MLRLTLPSVAGFSTSISLPQISQLLVFSLASVAAWTQKAKLITLMSQVVFILATSTTEMPESEWVLMQRSLILRGFEDFIPIPPLTISNQSYLAFSGKTPGNLLLTLQSPPRIFQLSEGKNNTPAPLQSTTNNTVIQSVDMSSDMSFVNLASITPIPGFLDPYFTSSIEISLAFYPEPDKTQHSLTLLPETPPGFPLLLLPLPPGEGGTPINVINEKEPPRPLSQSHETNANEVFILESIPDPDISLPYPFPTSLAQEPNPGDPVHGSVAATPPPSNNGKAIVRSVSGTDLGSLPPDPYSSSITNNNSTPEEEGYSPNPSPNSTPSLKPKNSLSLIDNNPVVEKVFLPLPLLPELDLAGNSSNNSLSEKEELEDSSRNSHILLTSGLKSRRLLSEHRTLEGLWRNDTEFSFQVSTLKGLPKKESFFLSSSISLPLEEDDPFPLWESRVEKVSLGLFSAANGEALGMDPLDLE